MWHTHLILVNISRGNLQWLLSVYSFRLMIFLGRILLWLGVLNTEIRFVLSAGYVQVVCLYLFNTVTVDYQLCHFSLISIRLFIVTFLQHVE